MIGENIPERHEQARADLEAHVAQFLASGGKIQDCGAAASVPRRPRFRWYPDQPAQGMQAPQVKQMVQKALPKPMPLVQDQTVQAAKPVAINEAKPDATQQTERQRRRQTSSKAVEELVEKIRAYSYTSLSRDAVAKLIGISQQRLTRLVDEHDIDFPKWRQPK